MTPPQTIAVIGAGAWGTALAGVAARAGRDVVLYARSPHAVAVLTDKRENPKLPGVPLDPRITVTGDLAAAARADVVLLVVPAQHLRASAIELAPHLAPQTPVVPCAKGIEHGPHRFMTEVIAEVAPRAVPAILSG